jgi:membrane protein required for colicin V production
MNVLDILLLLVLAFFGLRGIFRGLVKEAAGLVGIIVGVILARQLYTALTPSLAAFMADDSYADLASWAIIFVAGLVAVWLVAMLMQRVLKRSRLTWVDTLLGGLFGLLKAALVCSLGIMILRAVMPELKLYQTSALYPHFTMLIDLMRDFLPEMVREAIARGGQALDQAKSLHESFSGQNQPAQ